MIGGVGLSFFGIIGTVSRIRGVGGCDIRWGCILVIRGVAG